MNNVLGIYDRHIYVYIYMIYVYVLCKHIHSTDNLHVYLALLYENCKKAIIEHNPLNYNSIWFFLRHGFIKIYIIKYYFTH